MHWEINKCVGLDLLQYLLYLPCLQVELAISLKFTCTLFFVAQTVSALDISSSLRLAAVPYDQAQFFCFDHLLTFWHADSARKYLTP